MLYKVYINVIKVYIWYKKYHVYVIYSGGVVCKSCGSYRIVLENLKIHEKVRVCANCNHCMSVCLVFIYIYIYVLYMICLIYTLYIYIYVLYMC